MNISIYAAKKKPLNLYGACGQTDSSTIPQAFDVPCAYTYRLAKDVKLSTYWKITRPFYFFGLFSFFRLKFLNLIIILRTSYSK